MKYIVLETPDGEAPVVFPARFMHRYIAELFAPMTVASAGFVSSRKGRLDCHGASASLGLGARPRHDSALLARALSEADQKDR